MFILSFYKKFLTLEKQMVSTTIFNYFFETEFIDFLKLMIN
jgi:hypothetical protein